MDSRAAGRGEGGGRGEGEKVPGTYVSTIYSRACRQGTKKKKGTKPWVRECEPATMGSCVYWGVNTRTCSRTIYLVLCT